MIYVKHNMLGLQNLTVNIRDEITQSLYAI